MEDDGVSGDKLAGFDCRVKAYGSHPLQRVGIWECQKGQGKGRWVIFIHGGAWRDPRKTFRDFLPSIKECCKLGNDVMAQIAGFASIEYRLSAHPDFAQDLNNPTVMHPDHILDVHAALRFLQKECPIGNNYVLIGHSAGATLAFQTLMGEVALAKQSVPHASPKPAAVVGVSGIYDILGLKTRHKNISAYSEFCREAFGENESEWNQASPACFQDSFRTRWTSDAYSLLAYSPQDSLVDGPEIVKMAEKLKADRIKVDVVRDLYGEHDEVWKQGVQMTQLIAQALLYLKQNKL